MQTIKKKQGKTLTTSPGAIKIRAPKNQHYSAELEAVLQAFAKGCERYENALRELSKPSKHFFQEKLRHL